MPCCRVTPVQNGVAPAWWNYDGCLGTRVYRVRSWGDADLAIIIFPRCSVFSFINPESGRSSPRKRSSRNGWAQRNALSTRNENHIPSRSYGSSVDLALSLHSTSRRVCRQLSDWIRGKVTKRDLNRISSWNPWLTRVPSTAYVPTYLLSTW